MRRAENIIYSFDFWKVSTFCGEQPMSLDGTSSGCSFANDIRYFHLLNPYHARSDH